MSSTLQIDVLRTIDKWDRNGPEGTFDLLTDGKRDASGAMIKGCGLPLGQAFAIVAFTGITTHPHLANRLMMIEALEAIQTGPWTSALDDLRALNHPNWQYQLDDLWCLVQGRLPPQSSSDWDWRGFLETISRLSQHYDLDHCCRVMTPLLLEIRRLTSKQALEGDRE